MVGDVGGGFYSMIPTVPLGNGGRDEDFPMHANPPCPPCQGRMEVRTSPCFRRLLQNSKIYSKNLISKFCFEIWNRRKALEQGGIPPCSKFIRIGISSFFVFFRTFATASFSMVLMHSQNLIPQPLQRLTLSSWESR